MEYSKKFYIVLIVFVCFIFAISFINLTSFYPNDDVIPVQESVYDSYNTTMNNETDYYNIETTLYTVSDVYVYTNYTGDLTRYIGYTVNTTINGSSNKYSTYRNHLVDNYVSHDVIDINQSIKDRYFDFIDILENLSVTVSNHKVDFFLDRYGVHTYQKRSGFITIKNPTMIDMSFDYGVYYINVIPSVKICDELRCDHFSFSIDLPSQIDIPHMKSITIPFTAEVYGSGGIQIFFPKTYTINIYCEIQGVLPSRVVYTDRYYDVGYAMKSPPVGVGVIDINFRTV